MIDLRSLLILGASVVLGCGASAEGRARVDASFSESERAAIVRALGRAELEWTTVGRAELVAAAREPKPLGVYLLRIDSESPCLFPMPETAKVGVRVTEDAAPMFSPRTPARVVCFRAARISDWEASTLYALEENSAE